jgi:hypothetical protein
LIFWFTDDLKLDNYLQALQRNVPWFANKVMRDDEGRSIGVAWTTKTMREHFVRFGETLSLDEQKKNGTSSPGHIYHSWLCMKTIAEELRVRDS